MKILAVSLNRMIKNSIALVLFLAFAHTTFAAPDIVSQNLTGSGSFTPGSTITFSAVTKNVGTEMDTTNSYLLKKIGEYTAPYWTGSSLGIANGYAYVFSSKSVYDPILLTTTRTITLTTLNVQNPSNISVTNKIDWTSNILSAIGPDNIIISGNRLYAGNYLGDIGEKRDVMIFDISKPDAPILLGGSQIASQAAEGIALYNNRYIVSVAQQYASPIIDVLNPSAPVKVATIINNPAVGISNPRKVAVVGNYAVIARGANGTNDLEIYNIIDPANPALVSSLDLISTTDNSIFPEYISVIDNFVYVSYYYTNVLYIINISDKSNPIITNVINNFGTDATISGKYLYAINYSPNTDSVFDTSNPGGPVLVRKENVVGCVLCINTIESDTKYIYGTDTNRLKMFKPYTLSRFCIDSPGCIATTTGRIGGKDFDLGSLSANQTYATSTTWTATLGTHTIYYCSDIKNTSGYDGVAESNESNNCSSYTFIVPNVPVPPTVDVKINASNAPASKPEPADFDTTWTVSNLNPLLISATTTGASSANAVAVAGNYAYVGGFLTIRVFDISNKNTPVLVKTVPVSNTIDKLTIKDSYLYVGMFDGGSLDTHFKIYDISSPANPVYRGGASTDIIGDNGTGHLYDIKIVGNFAYVAEDYVYAAGKRLMIFNITDPLNPFMVGQYLTNGAAWGVAISGNYAYVGCDNSHIEIVDITDVSNPTFVANVPTLNARSKAIQISGSYMYVTGDSGNDVFEIYSLANPTAPIRTRSLTLGISGWATDIEINGSFAYVSKSGLDTEISIIDISSSTAAKKIGGFGTGIGNAIALQGEYAFIAAQTEFHIFKVQPISCIASDNGWNGPKALIGGLERYLGVLAGTWTYTMTCTAPSGSNFDSVAITVTPSFVPNLISQNLSASAGPYTQGSPINLTAQVRNTGSLATPSVFNDNFSYQFGTSINPLNWTDLTPFSAQGVLAANTTSGVSDTHSFTPAQSGTLWIQHCVDSNNVIAEGAGETPNCTVLSSLTVTQSCPLSSINYCLLPPTPVGGTAGACTGGYSGTCTYRCDASANPTGDWTLITNTCTPPATPPDLTATPRMVDYGSNGTLTYKLNGSTSCTITGGLTNETVTADGSITVPIYALTTFTLNCGVGLTDTATIEVRSNGFET
jgi:hypothetical protein